MKTIKIKHIVTAGIVLFATSCKQDVISLKQPATTPSTTPSKGSADFTKFIAVGNSFVAGVQAGALFTEGQNNSLPSIMAKQFAVTGVGGGTFTQPTIGASLGYNLFISPNPGADNKIVGRMLLQYGTNVSCSTGAPSPLPTPQKYALGNLEAAPNPSINAGFIFGDGTEKATLNNFGVPAIVLGQALISKTGDWSVAGSDPRFNPFYGRLAYPGNGTATIISDAATLIATPSTSGGATFFMFWLGLDDFFLYAAYGGDGTKAPLTSAPAFGGQYAAAVGALMNANPNIKGVLGNFPDIFKMPHFTAVAYNPIPLDQTKKDQLTAGFAGYNKALDGLVAYKTPFGISDALVAEIATRKVSFEVSCNNKILLVDETLTDLGPKFDSLKKYGAITQAQRDALVPYQQVRQTTSSDIIPLSTGSVLGTPGSFGLLGVSEPMADRYVIIPKERDEINAARVAYNNTVANTANAYSCCLALADVYTQLNTLVAAKAAVSNGVTITPKIDPPTGIYSEDGVHPNSRGYAYMANIFIDAINSRFGAKVPLANISQYSATALPIP